MPFASKYPWRCAAHSGTFQPPSNAITDKRVGGSEGGCPKAAPATNSIAATDATRMIDRGLIQWPLRQEVLGLEQAAQLIGIPAKYVGIILGGARIELCERR